MTNKEAKETILMALAEVEWNYPLDYAIAFEKAIETLEEAYKYRWHDLRKNPKDLPIMYENVYVFDGLSYYVWSRVPLERVPSEDSWIWEDEKGYYSDEQDDVIAWREIKPFEEG